MFVLILFLHFLLCASGCVLQLSALQIFCKGTTFLFICNSLSVLNLIFPLSVFFLRAVLGEGGSVFRAVLSRLFPGFWASGFLGFRRAIYNKVWSKGCFRRFANKASLASKQDLFTMQRSLVWKPKKPCFFVDGFSCVMQAVLCRFFTSRRCTPLPRVRSWVGSSLPLPNGRGRAG